MEALWCQIIFVLDKNFFWTRFKVTTTVHYIIKQARKKQTYLVRGEGGHSGQGFQGGQGCQGFQVIQGFQGGQDQVIWNSKVSVTDSPTTRIELPVH